jgi:hypothetical protein
MLPIVVHPSRRYDVAALKHLRAFLSDSNPKAAAINHASFRRLWTTAQQVSDRWPVLPVPGVVDMLRTSR